MAFGYVITDDDFRVMGIVPNEEFENYKTVENVEDYKIGDLYPKHGDEDYDVAVVKFVNGVNEKEYVFRDYSCALEPDEYVLVDTVFGTNVARVVHLYPKDTWKGIEPTKDVISWIPDYEEYAERMKERKRKVAEELKASKEEEKSSDEVIKLLSKMFASSFGDIFANVD